MQYAINVIFTTYILCTMHPPGLGEFPATSLSETELFEKFAVPQAEITVQEQNHSLRNIQTFSGVNLDLSGTETAGRAQCGRFIQIMSTLIIRSLDLVILDETAFWSSKKQMKDKIT